MKKTSDLKVTFLGINPSLEDSTGKLDAQSICAFSALLTFKGKSVQTLKQDAVDKDQDINKKIKNILRKSSLRGHASIATTPVLSFSYEASKFLDSALTGMVFSSSFMASGRRTDTDHEDIIFPSSIEKNKEAYEIYLEASKNNIDISHKLLENGIEKDQASKILQYGIYGTGTISYSIESFNSLRREYEREKEWMPEEIGIFLNTLENELKNLGVDLLYYTRAIAPRNTYPYPNIFKNPRNKNLVRDMAEKFSFNEECKILSIDNLTSENLKERMDKLKEKLTKAYQDKEYMINNWYDLLEERASIARDYQNALNIKLLSRLTWRVWGEKKRHRTMPMTVESVYFSINRTSDIWEKFANEIENNSLSEDQIKILDNACEIPPEIKSEPRLMYDFMSAVLKSLRTYRKLIEFGIPHRDAIFIIPRALRIDMIIDCNFYNLISGYYPLRLCTKAEEQLRRVTREETEEMKLKFKDSGLDWLNWHLRPKCYNVGFCPEEKSCFMIKKDESYYDDLIHEEMEKDLDAKFEKLMSK